MNYKTEVSLSAIERLPVELLQQILYSLEDSETLQDAVLSCPIFCNSYKEAKALITLRVLDVDIQVLPEILTAFEASQLKADPHDAKDKAILDDFVKRNLQQRPEQPSWAKISQMVPYLWRLYPIVDYFSRRFADEALTRRAMKRASTPPSKEELRRFMRAFYRFETYCAFFRDLDPMKVTSPVQNCVRERRQMRVFFDHYAPYEIEQLACVYDFLIATAMPDFNVLADEDIILGALKCQWGEEVYERSIGLLGLLAAGLERVFRFLEGETYEDKEKAVFLDIKYPVQKRFLYQAFDHLNVMFWTARDPRILYDRLPHCSDADPGPGNSWRQIHTGTDVGGPSELVYHDEGSALRQCAYVMWDQSRLKKAKLFKNPFRFEEERRLPWMTEEEQKRHDRRMRESWMRRTTAYQLGGRGQYSQLHDDMKRQVEQKTAEHIAKWRRGERGVTPITRRGSI